MMDGKISPIPPEKVIKVLEKVGFSVIRQKGSHVFLRHQDGRTTVVPFHKGEDLGIGLLRKIMRDASLSHDEFIVLLRKR